MIDAKHLMIGNWLEFHDGTQCQVNSWDINLINTDGYDHLYSPIALTPAVLERCGFVFSRSKIAGDADIIKGTIEVDGFTIQYDYHGGCTDNNYYQGHERMLLVSDNEADGFGTLKLTHCQHLHQLQNLFFALTGAELNYKPI